MCRLNQVNLSAFHRSQAKGKVFFGKKYVVVNVSYNYVCTICRTAMPVDSDPCSCQPDCLVCGRGNVPPHDCAFHVLLESMVFQERMLHGEPTEARLEEILQSRKEYLPRAMHMTD
ncbi:uncharacterized protein TNCV_2753851 [Trichonephila clavipes]|nr:uncharacterized protein TNCV_2753851 [Trichonephila clavipes]